ncbi:MAG TPA: VWA domain-containing protein [Cytophagaceae bacterium]
MKHTIAVLLLLIISNLAYGQKKTVYGDLKSSDSTELNIITVRPDSFPSISIIFEAVKDNEPVFGLNKNLLTVTEDEKICNIIKITQIEENYPINISLIIDHSGSMQLDPWQLIDSVSGKSLLQYHIVDNKVVPLLPEGYVPPIDNAKKAVSEFINEINTGKDSVQVIGFSNVVDIYSSFSNDKKYLQSFIDSINANGSTAFLDAINFSLDSIKYQSGIKVIVALTDGLDNSSHITVKDLIQKAKDLKIPIYTIGLGEVDKKFLSDISKNTGGAFYYTKNSNSLSIIYKDIQKRIRSIYDLQYISENLNPDQTLRKVKIRFAVDSLFLTNNTAELNLSPKVIEYIRNKKKKEFYQTVGLGITATATGAGIILFYYRRKRRKNSKDTV